MTLGSRSIEVSTATIRDWARFIQTSMDTRETRLETGDNFAAQGTEWEFGLFRTTRIAAGEHAMSCNVAQRQGQGTPARLHALFQISGEALVHKPGRCQRFRPGEWSLNTDGRDYRVEYFGDVQQIVLQIPWDSVAGYRNLLDPMSRTVFRFDEGIGQVFFRFLEAACETEAGRSTTATVALSGMAMQLFQATVFELSGQNASGAARAEFAERLFAEIRAQLANPALSVELLAQRLGCSKGYLHRAFRGSGLPGSLSGYIAAERLDAARRMLEHPGEGVQPIAVVAWRCGFGDPSHFARAFKARFGRTPSAVREAGLSSGSIG